MIQRKYSLKKEDLYVSSIENTDTFFLTDKKGGYYFSHISKKIRDYSHYCGAFFSYKTPLGWNMYKTITPIQLDKSVKSLQTDFCQTTVTFEDKTSVTYHMDESMVQIFIQNYTGNIDIPFDCRPIYHFDDMDKEYTYKKIDGFHIFTFMQQNHQLENGQPNSCVIGIKTSAEFKTNPSWFNQSYYLEQKRQTQPQSYWVYKPGSFFVDSSAEFTIAYGFDLKQVIQKLESITQTKQNKIIQNTIQDSFLPTLQKKQRFCYMASLQTIFDLQVHHHGYEGLYAGLPWFFDFWTRDEAISLGSFISIGKYDFVKRVIFRQLRHLQDDGRIQNRVPFSELGSADGIGWTCKRLHELLQVANLEKSELEFLFTYLKISQKNIEQTYLQDGLIYNKPLETWMDTGNPYDVRDGFRIEIQALYAVQLQTLSELAKRLEKAIEYEYYIQKEKEFVRSVQLKLCTSIVYDGLNVNGELDQTTRPNVFLAHYIYPKLCLKTVWKKTFKICLNELWQDWGGISTISKNNPLYKSTYTGQTNESYHRGDVWFWVNNVCAISLDSIGGFDSYVRKIIQSSMSEILSMGAFGRHAEVSSAQQLSSHGCLMQLWSSALFVECIQKLYKK